MKRTLSTLLQLLPLTALAGSFGGPGSLAPDRAFDVRHLHLDLTVLPETRRVQCAAELRVVPFPGGDTWTYRPHIVSRRDLPLGRAGQAFLGALLAEGRVETYPAP